MRNEIKPLGQVPKKEKRDSRDTCQHSLKQIFHLDFLDSEFPHNHSFLVEKINFHKLLFMMENVSFEMLINPANICMCYNYTSEKSYRMRPHRRREGKFLMEFLLNIGRE